MSRKHAKLEADLVKKVVYIKDEGSTHGTYLNNESVKSLHPLASGDEVRFGIQIDRSKESYPPLLASINVNWLYTVPVVSSGTYRLPEETDNEISDDAEDEEKALNFSSQVTAWPVRIDSCAGLTEQEYTETSMSHAGVTLDVDPSPNPDTNALSYEPNVPSGCWRATATPNLHESNTDDDELRSVSQFNIEDDMSSYQQSDGGLFPADSSLEDENEDHSTGTGHYSQQPSENNEASEASAEKNPSDQLDHEEDAPGLPLSPDHDLAIPSSQEMPPINNWATPEETVTICSPGQAQPNRPPSPSDAVMPRAMPKLDINISPQAQELGRKTGKPEYFAAREENRRLLENKQGVVSASQISLPPIYHSSTAYPGWTALPSGSASFAPAVENSQDVDGEWPDKCGNEPSAIVAPDAPTSSPYRSHGGRTHVGISELVNKPIVVEGDGLADEVTTSTAAQSSMPKSSMDVEADPLAGQLTGEKITRMSELDSDDSLPEIHDQPREHKSPKWSSSQLAGSKRRIDDVSGETRDESEWQVTQSPKEIVSDGNELSQLETSKDVLERVDTLHPGSLSASESMPKATDTEQERPIKRRRRVAEIVGVAAISALSAGIGVFAALVATAPNFD